MKKSEFVTLLKAHHNAMMKLTLTKGEEYSRSDDQLANFKRAAQEAGITPLQAWLVFFNKHIDSIKSYIKNPDMVLSEPITGRFEDASLYLMLGMALVIEGDDVQE